MKTLKNFFPMLLIVPALFANYVFAQSGGNPAKEQAAKIQAVADILDQNIKGKYRDNKATAMINAFRRIALLIEGGHLTDKQAKNELRIASIRIAPLVARILDNAIPIGTRSPLRDIYEILIGWINF